MATGSSGLHDNARAPVGEKLFYRIGEVSRLTGLPAYVLRFWELEFSFLRPHKNRGRHRVYTHKDIETLLHIKRLRYEQGLSIEGLRRRWHTKENVQERKASRTATEVVRRVKQELQGILKVLGDTTDSSSPS